MANADHVLACGPHLSITMVTQTWNWKLFWSEQKDAIWTGSTDIKADFNVDLRTQYGKYLCHTSTDNISSIFDISALQGPILATLPLDNLFIPTLRRALPIMLTPPPALRTSPRNLNCFSIIINLFLWTQGIQQEKQQPTNKQTNKRRFKNLLFKYAELRATEIIGFCSLFLITFRCLINKMTQ